MTQMVDQMPSEAPSGTDDLVAGIQRVLEASAEPLTVSKIKSQLPPRCRALNIEDALQRQVAAKVLHQYPKYRSQQDRYWDRPMPVHVAALLRSSLEPGPLPWSELRRRLPAYAVAHAEPVLEEEIAKGRLHRHPRLGVRGGERFGVRAPDPKDFLGSELSAVFANLGQLGFDQTRIRTAMLELLHDQEWGPEPVAPRQPKAKGGDPSETAAPE